MGPNLGRTVRLFLVEGSMSGLVTAEIINWTGHALVAPRDGVGEALTREEASRTGIYFLVGEDPEQPTKAKVYVGEGDVVADRIRTHAKDSAKDFWTKVCIFTSKDPNLTKAHVRYLESRIVELIKASEQANLANLVGPGVKSLPESEVADMEYFIEQIQLVLPVLGFGFLKPRPYATKTYLEVAPHDAGMLPLDLTLTSKSYDLEANAIQMGDDFTVLAGSGALVQDFAYNAYKSLRDQLISDKRLCPSENPQLLKFSQDVSFASPSAAASVIFNHNSNGRTAWKLKGTDKTLRDWQDEQISDE